LLLGSRQSEETRILQRAYLSVEPDGIHAHNERGRAVLKGEKGPHQSVPQIRIQNAGNLPAREIKWLIEHKFSHDRRLNDFPIKEDKSEGRNVLPPGAVMTQGGVADALACPREAAEPLSVEIHK